jgi:small nuclear ribonucleoprotein (snRNP)-like protein
MFEKQAFDQLTNMVFTEIAQNKEKYNFRTKKSPLNRLFLVGTFIAIY